MHAMIMKRLLPLLGALALGAAFATPALADGRVHFGISVGVPAYYPYYYRDPYFYYPPPPQVVVVPSSPPTYIERNDSAASEAPASTDWWYYCAESKAYYPYVKHCPGGWQRVAPQPAQQ
jgi:hypothetical protein